MQLVGQKQGMALQRMIPVYRQLEDGVSGKMMLQEMTGVSSLDVKMETVSMAL